MPDEIQQLRREIARLQDAHRPTAVRYPPALRRKVIALARRQRGRGGELATLARRLRLTPWTLTLWLRQQATPRLRPVKLVAAIPSPTSPVTAPVLITREGVRIEGAPVEMLITLLRALA